MGYAARSSCGNREIVAALTPDFDSTWIRGVDYRLRDKDIGAPGGKAVYLGAQARWRIGGGV
jgi:hypothetical protein